MGFIERFVMLRYPVRRQVVVNTKTDRAFRGVVWRVTGRYLVLRNAQMLKAKKATVQIDGEVVIERDNVDFLQVV